MDTTTRAAKIPSLHQTEINWDNLDKTKLYVVGAGMFSGVTVALYPVSVVKTRMQVASGDALRRNALATFKNILKISQKLMVQGYSGNARYKGGIDVARKVIKADGIRGLYRGFGLSVMTYAPSSAVWWASYGSSQRIIWSALGHWKQRRGS